MKFVREFFKSLLALMRSLEWSCTGGAAGGSADFLRIGGGGGVDSGDSPVVCFLM